MSPIVLNGRYYRGYPADRHLGHAEEALELAPDETAFLLVDVYGLGFDEGAPPPPSPTLLLWELFEKQKAIVCHRIRPARDAAMRAGLPIVYVQNHSPRLADNRSEFGRLCQRTEYGESTTLEDEYGPDSPALEYSDVIAPPPGAYVVKKTMYDGFFETNLDTLLRNLRIRNLVCVGFSAEICLLATLIGAMYRNYRVVLLRDCTLGTEYPDTAAELAMTNVAVRYVERLVGYTAASADFIEGCAAAGSDA